MDQTWKPSVQEVIDWGGLVLERWVVEEYDGYWVNGEMFKFVMLMLMLMLMLMMII